MRRFLEFVFAVLGALTVSTVINYFLTSDRGAVSAAGEIPNISFLRPGTTGTIVRRQAPLPESGIKSCSNYFLLVPKGLMGNKDDQLVFTVNALTPSGVWVYDVLGILPPDHIKPKTTSLMATPEFTVLGVNPADGLSEIEVNFSPTEWARTCLSNPRA